MNHQRSLHKNPPLCLTRTAIHIQMQPHLAVCVYIMQCQLDISYTASMCRISPSVVFLTLLSLPCHTFLSTASYPPLHLLPLIPSHTCPLPVPSLSLHCSWSLRKKIPEHSRRQRNCQLTVVVFSVVITLATSAAAFVDW